MLTLTQRVYIIISVFIGLLAVVIIFVLFAFRSPEPKEEPGGSQPASSAPATLPAVSSPSAAEVKLPVLTPAEQDELYVRQLAKIFAERFASLSNQNNNRHISDVLNIITSEMKIWVEKQTVDPSKPYYGVTTVVAASRVASISEIAATVKIDAQREITDEKGTRTEQQTGRVELEKIDGEWKVDGLYWD